MGKVATIANKIEGILSAIAKGTEPDLSSYDENTLLSILIETLENPRLTQEQKKAIFNLVLIARPSHDISVIHNLGLLAAQTSLIREAEAIALDSLDNEYFASAATIAEEAMAKTNNKEIFKSILEEIAKRGHFQTKVLLFDKRFSRWGMLGVPAKIVYRAFLLPQVLFTAMKNIHDPKLNALPGKIFK